MTTESIKTVLKDSGITEKEAEIYIFLAKHGVLTGGEIVRQTRIHRALVYRILKNLQAKGYVESTLEVPAQFSAVSFEKILDAHIKAKKEEATSIEEAREFLLTDWQRIARTGVEPSLQRFSVIEGRRKISSKIIQMIRDTRNQLATVNTAEALLRAEQFDFFDAMASHPSKSSVSFRVLTDVSDQNLKAAKALLKIKPKAKVCFKVTNLDLNAKLAPPMVIRDDEEIVIFISNSAAESISKESSLCMWTNCKDIVQPFASVFAELWQSATDIDEVIAEIEKARPAMPKTFVYCTDNSELAKKRYDDRLYLAKQEVTIMTTSQGLMELSKEALLIEEWKKHNITVRIMAPVTSKNEQVLQKLPANIELRHIPMCYLRTTVVDSKCLFQFKNLPPEQEQQKPLAYLENVFSTSDHAVVYRMKVTLDNLWKNSLASSQNPAKTEELEMFRKQNGYIQDAEGTGTLTEKDVLEKIVNSKRMMLKGDPARYVTRLYGSRGVAVIHPPDSFELPDMMIAVYHLNKRSSFGAEDFMVIHLWLKTLKGYSWIPVAHITDNSRALPHRKVVFAATPAEKNIQVVKNDFEVGLQGNTLFAGWAIPICLLPPRYTLPPSCIQFDGYGELRTGVLKLGNRSGRRQIIEYNGFNAFVTFFHPLSKYSGPGTEGVLFRDMIMTAYPPSEDAKLLLS